MKAGWKTVKLGAVARYDKAQGNHSGLPYVGLEHIESGTRKFIGSRSDMEVQSATFLFNPNHVLYGRLRPYLRKVLVPDFAGHCSTEIFPILPSDDLDRSYLSYWLITESTTGAIDRLCNGARMPRANMEQALELEVPLPPLAEQKRIVALLDEAFAGIDEAMAKAETNADNSMALWNAILHSTFSGNDRDWPLITLDDCCSKVTDGTHHSPKVQFSQRLSGTYPYVTSKNIRNNYIDLSKISYVEESFHREVYSRCKPAVGDVLLTKDGANTGQVVVNTIDEPFSLLSSVCLLKPEREMLSPHFLCYFLQSPQGTSSLVSEMTGAAIKRLILKTIKKATIPLPPLDEQNRLIKFLDEGRKLAERLHTNNERSIKLYTELKASLLSQAFAGELTA